MAFMSVKLETLLNNKACVCPSQLLCENTRAYQILSVFYFEDRKQFLGFSLPCVCVCARLFLTSSGHDDRELLNGSALLHKAIKCPKSGVKEMKMWEHNTQVLIQTRKQTNSLTPSFPSIKIIFPFNFLT